MREGEEFEIFDEEGEATESKPKESSEADEPAPKFAWWLERKAAPQI